MLASNGSIKKIVFAALAALVLILAALRTSWATPVAVPWPHHPDNPWIALAQAPQAPTSGVVPYHIIEQYKAYVADLGNVGTQVATTETFFLTMISGLFAVFAFKEMPRPVEHFVTPASIMVFGFIFLVSVAWLLTMLQFKNLFEAKLDVLQSIEGRYADLYPMFTEQEHRELTSVFTRYGDITHLLLLPATFGSISFALLSTGVIRCFSNSKSAEAGRFSASNTGGSDSIDR